MIKVGLHMWNSEIRALPVYENELTGSDLIVSCQTTESLGGHTGEIL